MIPDTQHTNQQQPRIWTEPLGQQAEMYADLSPNSDGESPSPATLQHEDAMQLDNANRIRDTPQEFSPEAINDRRWKIAQKQGYFENDSE